MSNVIGSLTGANKAKAAQQQASAMSALALTQAQSSAQAAQAQEAQAQSDQGQQLALLAKQQATTDNSAASLSAPGIGRAVMGYQRRTSGTLGG